MIILGLETTGSATSVAVLDNEKIISEFIVDDKLSHSSTTMPMLENIFNYIDIDIEEIDYIACSTGPGSFTGLRIGVSTAKGLAHGLDKKIIDVPTLDALAYNIFHTDAVIVPILDARRNQVYTSSYYYLENKLVRQQEYLCIQIEELLDNLSNLDKTIVFLGDGVKAYREIIQNRNNEKFIFAPIHLNKQKASSVASLAFEILSEKRVLTYNELEPFYLRKPQAEREYEEKNK